LEGQLKRFEKGTLSWGRPKERGHEGEKIITRKRKGFGKAMEKGSSRNKKKLGK